MLFSVFCAIYLSGNKDLKKSSISPVFLKYSSCPETSSEVRKGISEQVEPSSFASHCHDWVESGVQIIGGCCGTTIEHIRTMVDELFDVIGPRR